MDSTKLTEAKDLLGKVNPETGRPYGKKEIAKRIGTTEWQIRKIAKRLWQTLGGKVDPPEPEPDEFQTGRIVIPEHYGTVLAGGDIHFPFQDKKCVAAFLKAAEIIKPKIVMLMGDLVDFHEISRYRKDPLRITTLQDEIDETVDFTRDLRKLLPSARIVYIAGNHECHDTETEILTHEGWKKYDEFGFDDLLATYNIEKDKIEWQNPGSINRSPYKGKLEHVRANSTDMMITPNHRVMYRLPAHSSWSLQEVSKIHHGNNRVIFKASSSEDNNEYPLSDDEISIAAWMLTDCYIDKKYGYVTFYQRDEKVHLITDILDRLGIQYHRYDRQRDITHICGVELKTKPNVSCDIRLNSEYSKRLHHLVRYKGKLPSWVYMLSDRQFGVFLSSFIDADGSRHKSCPDTSWMAYGTKQILDDLQVACFLHGYCTSLSVYRERHYKLNITKYTESALDRFGTHVSYEDYDGIVWCAEVPNGTLVTRRNGKVNISGNSRLKKFLSDRAPELSSLRDIRFTKLMKFDELNIEYTERDVKIGDLLYIHGERVSKHSGYTAKANLEDIGVSVICGHCHRMGMHFKTTRGGDFISVEGGTMASMVQDYVEPSKPNWQHGFTTIDYNGKQFWINLHQVFEGKTSLRGKIIG